MLPVKRRVINIIVQLLTLTGEMAFEYTYNDLIEAYRRNNSEHSAYVSFLESFKPEWDLSAAQSCVAIGAGKAEREIEFIKRFMPNLRKFVAVDPDRQFTIELNSILKNRLPDVELVIYHEDIEKWSVPEDLQVDAILLFNVLYYFTESVRQEIFLNQLSGRLLAKSGFVVMLHEVESKGSSATWDLYSTRSREAVNGDQTRKDVTDAGFNLIDERNIDFIVNTNSIFEGTETGTRLVELYRLFAPESLSHDDVRRVLLSQSPEIPLCTRLSVYQRSY